MTTAIVVSQVTVGTSAVLLAAADAGRQELRIRPLTAGVLWIGPTNAVTPATGYNPCGNVPQAQNEFIILTTDGDIYGVVDTGTNSMEVAVLEILGGGAGGIPNINQITVGRNAGVEIGFDLFGTTIGDLAPLPQTIHSRVVTTISWNEPSPGAFQVQIASPVA